MTHDLTTGKPLRDIWQFAVPVLFGLLLQQVYSLVDTAIVGHALGVMALGGVGATGSVNFLVIGFCGGLMGVGVSIVISKLLNYLAMNGGLGSDGNSFLGGMMGGFGMMGGGSRLSIIPVWLMLAAIGFATIIGLVAGFYPANRAVKISALEAIKHE